MSPPRSYPYDAFISHSSADKAWVRGFVKQLREAGIRVWFDEDDLKWGEAIRKGVQRGIEESRHLVLVMSPASVGGGEDPQGSGWVTLEHYISGNFDPANQSRRLLPLLLSDCTIPSDIKPFRYLDVRTSEGIERHWPTIVGELGGGHDLPPPPPPHGGARRSVLLPVALATAVAALAVALVVSRPLWVGESPPRAAPSVAQPQGMTLDAVMLAHSPGEVGYRALEDGASVQDGVQYRVRLKLSRSAYVAVYSIAPNGDRATLIPAEGESPRMYSHKATLRLPERGAFVFFGDPGVETFYIVASKSAASLVPPWGVRAPTITDG